MADLLPVTGSLAIPRTELTWRFSRSGGPGGQSVNTADSRVELRFDLAGTDSIPDYLKTRALQRLQSRLVDGAIVVTASEHRSQLQNRRAAEARLVALLADAVAAPAKPRRATRPSRASVERRIASKKRRSQTKHLRRETGE
nr:alternative ribosome rescue aminoacyl-tRNA hydrolase ArfB [Rugosimonospora africana]